MCAGLLYWFFFNFISVFIEIKRKWSDAVNNLNPATLCVPVTSNDLDLFPTLTYTSKFVVRAG
jgi:hypothetical protein